jgi:hypothetical protein
LNPKRIHYVVTNVSNWDNDPAPSPYYDAAPDDDDDTWFHPVTYDQTAYPDVEPGPALEDEYLALDETIPDLPPYRSPGPGPGRDPGQEPLDDYAGYDDFQPGPAWQDEPPRRDEPAWQDKPPWRPEAAWQERPVPDESWPPRLPRVLSRRITAGGRPPWRIVGAAAVAAAALGFGAVIVTGRVNHSLPSSALPAGTIAPGATMPGTVAPGTAMPAVPSASATTQLQPPAGQPPITQPPITQVQAQQVLATYTSANNMANAQASQAQLATVETGGSLAIDGGIDQVKSASGAAPYPAYGPAHASYYIPLESPGYPRWFAVQVQNALASAPGQLINSEYLVFTQGTPGAPWKDAIEPFILPGATPPQVAIDANGYATAVTANDAGLALSPATAGEATATALDNRAGEPAIPGNLADQQALAALRREFPATSSETDRHSAATEPVFGLRTVDGGALLFYDVAAQVTVAAQAGGTLPLNVPGFLSPGSPAAHATLDYLEQFAAYDPPAGGAGQGAQGPVPSVVADYSGITGAAQ